MRAIATTLGRVMPPSWSERLSGKSQGLLADQAILWINRKVAVTVDGGASGAYVTAE